MFPLLLRSLRELLFDIGRGLEKGSFSLDRLSLTGPIFSRRGKAMPWSLSDVDKHKKGLSLKQKRQWVEVANSVLSHLLGLGTAQGEAEARAIKAANSKVGRPKVKEGQTNTIEDAPLVETYLGLPSQESIDSENGLVKGIKILGETSTNGRRYRREVREEAISLYEGKPVNLNHPPPDKPDQPRSVLDRFGLIENVKERGDGLYGDFKFNPNHSYALTFLWWAKHSPGSVGFSHNAAGRLRRSRGLTEVDKITQVFHVDLVGDPATTKGLFEQQLPPGEEEMNYSEITLESLNAERPDLIKSVTEQVKTSLKEDEEYKQLKEENAQLKKKVDEHEVKEAARSKKEKIEKLLAESKLPEVALTDVFKDQLLEAKDDETIKGLIEDRKKLIVDDGKPTSRAKSLQEGTGGKLSLSVDDLVSQVK